jgi:glycine cleavage system regulatory protein
MQTSLVITVIGPDRPGLVESLSSAINDHGGNWTESRMAHLAGQFAGILHVQMATESAGALQAALESLSTNGLKVVVATDTSAAVPTDGLTLKLDLVGQDRPGIVKEISHALAERGVNVEELETECESAPMSGEILFKANATLRAPADVDIDALQTDLEAIAQDLMVELHLDRS